MGSIDPLRDIEVINTELILADITSLENQQDKLVKKARGGDKEAALELALIERLLPHLDAARPALTLETSDDEARLLKDFFLLTSKPTIFACNVSEEDFANCAADPESTPPAGAVTAYARETHETEAVVISAAIEDELSELSEEDAAGFLQSLGVPGSGVSRLIKAVYHLLGLRTYLTSNEKATSAWTIPAGAKAPEAAGVIHTDFQRGFIAAEVIGYEELRELGSTARAREAGKLRIEGKEYEVQDGDVIEFRFNV